MTRTTPSFQPRQSNHGHKRKGKPVESWMLELEKAQEEENGSQSLDLTTIEQIANGVEQMVFSWGLHKQERGQEYAKLSKSLAKENSHVLLPWSLNKTEELGLDSASESDLPTKNETLETADNLVPIAMQPQVAQSRTTVIATKHTSLKRATQPKQRENRQLDDFGNSRDSLESALENPQSLKTRNLPQFCHGVLTSSNRMRDCFTQNRGKILHEFETRAREDATCLAMTAEQESICESIELEIGKDNCMSGNMCISSTKWSDISKKGHNPFNAKETEFQSCLRDRSPTWTPEAATPMPETRNQQSMLNHTRDQYLPSNLTCDSLRNTSPHLLNQSPLCAQSPSPRHETIQNSEVISNEHGGLFTSLIDLPLYSPIYENEREAVDPLLPFLDASPCCREDTESVKVGGHTIKVTTLRGGNDVLEDKFQALVNINACALGVQEEHHLKPSPTSDVEDLQIALLECAMEYEIKTIEAKMKMQELKLKGQHNVVVVGAFSKSEQPCPHRAIEPVLACEKTTMDNQRLQQLKKQMTKLQHEKDNLNNELHAFREKERQFERQKRSLEDALLRVNRLQREVVKKEQEVVEWQLKEKETKAQLQEVGEKLKRERHHAQVSLPLEPKKLLTLLLALREWLRSLKKVGLTKATAERRQFQDKEEGVSAHPHMMDAYNMQPAALHSRDKGMPVVPAHLNLLGQLSEELANQSNRALNVHQVDMVICCLTKEIHALQKELSKLARG